MMFAQLVSKFGLQMLPAVAASVLSAAVLGALQLTPGPVAMQTQRGASESGEPIVYVDVMPRINRDPAAPAVASVPSLLRPRRLRLLSRAPQGAATPPAAERPAQVASTARRRGACARRLRKIEPAASKRRIRGNQSRTRSRSPPWAEGRSSPQRPL